MTLMKNHYNRWRAKRRHRRLLQQVIPEEEVDELDMGLDMRSSKYINRPGFSLPLMTNNFRRFNARLVSCSTMGHHSLNDTQNRSCIRLPKPP